MTGESYRRQYCIVLDASCDKAPSKKKKKQQTTEHTHVIEVALSVYIIYFNTMYLFSFTGSPSVTVSVKRKLYEIRRLLSVRHLSFIKSVYLYVPLLYFHLHRVNVVCSFMILETFMFFTV